MPRYFFDLHDDLDVADREGKELPGVRAAIDRAIIEARALIAATVQEGHINLTHRIDVRDEACMVLTSVSFEDAVAVLRGAPPIRGA